MPGKGSLKRRREKAVKSLSVERFKKRDALEARLAENLTAEEAFERMWRRVVYLNDKIAWNRANDLKFELYIREREAIFWMLDKIKELSEKLLQVEKRLL